MVKQQDVLEALDEVFAIAERNKWVHGHIISVGSNPERLARFKVEYNEDKKEMRAECKFIDDFNSPFAEFTDTLVGFFDIAKIAFHLQPNEHDEYLTTVLKEQAKKEASSCP